MPKSTRKSSQISTASPYQVPAEIKPELEGPPPSPTYCPRDDWWCSEPDYSGSDPLKQTPYQGDYCPSSPPYSPTSTRKTNTEKKLEGIKQIVEKFPVLGRLLTLGRQNFETRIIGDWMAAEMKEFCENIDNN